MPINFEEAKFDRIKPDHCALILNILATEQIKSVDPLLIPLQTLTIKTKLL
jgi:hypothetical protein